jgi:diadenosine tetraphosphate (Ap4A) HIT family hydrolase
MSLQNPVLKEEFVENMHAMSFENKYPVTQGHMLVSPLRHIQSFFDLRSSEQKACLLLLEHQNSACRPEKDNAPSGAGL